MIQYYELTLFVQIYLSFIKNFKLFILGLNFIIFISNFIIISDFNFNKVIYLYYYWIEIMINLDLAKIVYKTIKVHF